MIFYTDQVSSGLSTMPGQNLKLYELQSNTTESELQAFQFRFVNVTKVLSHISISQFHSP